MSQNQQLVEDNQQLPASVVGSPAEVTEPALPGETGFHRKVGEQSQLVPVAEAIKYRKRAQVAEQQVEQLTEQLKKHERDQKETQARLEEAQQEAELIQALMQAGTIDVEAALLLVQKRAISCAGKERDISRLIDNLRSERPHLFSDGVAGMGVNWASPTAGARAQNHSGINRLGRVAQQARRSGSRKDMQEYLRLRRSIRG